MKYVGTSSESENRVHPQTAWVTFKDKYLSTLSSQYPGIEVPELSAEELQGQDFKLRVAMLRLLSRGSVPSLADISELSKLPLGTIEAHHRDTVLRLIRAWQDKQDGVRQKDPFDCGWEYEVHSYEAYRAELAEAAQARRNTRREAKIRDAVESLRREGKKITKAAVADFAGTSIATINKAHRALWLELTTQVGSYVSYSAYMAEKGAKAPTATMVPM